MQLAIDWDLCVGSGLCLAAAPGAFALTGPPTARRAILVGPAPDEALLAAARACPTLALRLRQADGTRLYPPPAGGS
jgi:ferredoxin